ncbi:MAG: cytochrome c biogenesis protein CcsA [Phycisphaerae bacterium]|nr:cytochrome c biogenesis protein CcsA [Phycisphaerae bacterium]
MLVRNVAVVLLVNAILASIASAAETPLSASEKAAYLDSRINWSEARLIAVQDAGRYKTLDSFARESMTAMTGREHLPGLSPLASLFEWMFNRSAYLDEPIVRIKDRGVQIHLSAHFPESIRRRIQDKGLMTPRELADRTVQTRLAELEPKNTMVTAMRRVRDAQVIVEALDRLIRIVPSPGGAKDDPWFTPEALRGNLPANLRSAQASGVPGVPESQAVAVMGSWANLWKGWTAADAGKVQESLDDLAGTLPTLAAAGVYPSHSQRAAEASYYSLGKLTWGYWFYLVGAILGVWALVTEWPTPRRISMLLLIVAMLIHAYGISLRWYILGRIPVANMFEAVVGSAWIGIAMALLAEWRYKTRVFLLGAHVTGFLALVLGGYVIPGGGTLTTIMGILDDVMLRIHTVLIIASYALIFLASIIAIVYLFGYYHHISPGGSALVGLITAFGGVAIWLLEGFVFQEGAEHVSGLVKNVTAANYFWWATAASGVLLLWTGRNSGAIWLASMVNLFVLCLTLAIGNSGFAVGMGYSLAGTGSVWALLNWIGIVRRARAGLPVAANAGGLARALGQPILATAAHASTILPGGYVADSHRLRRSDRPVLAGAAPGDEGSASLPDWLHRFDWSHLIILNMVFIMLFVGIILGAVWADYSWGRPWGWDPKEVFALNTWIIYAILMHVRFVAKNRGLWTAWLSVAGCLMMAFNWCFVNFFIVGLHSYA